MREADRLARTLGIEAYAIPRGEQRSWVVNDWYCGGNVRMDVGGIHPDKLHAAMLRRALAAGARVHGETAVIGIVAERTGLYGHHHAGNDGGHPRDRRAERPHRRVGSVAAPPYGPTRSRIVATAPISPNLMATLMPRRMMLSVSWAGHCYYRPWPDGTRILSGGRDGAIADDAAWPTTVLRDTLDGLSPELSDTPVTHSWFGQVAMNRDMVPRILRRRGIRYANGYCGSGNVLARWAEHKAARQVLGEDAGRSALDFHPLAAVLLSNGTTWFMPGVFAWMRRQDRMAARVRAKLADAAAIGRTGPSPTAS